VSWALALSAAEDVLEIAAAELFELQALGVEIEDRDTLPAGPSRCVAHFTEREDAFAAASALRAAFPALEVPAPLEIPAQDWSTAWRRFHRPVRVGARSWVHPPWEPPEAAPGDVLVSIDPGMAFGTGSHPTTALCLERIDELLRPGLSVLDVGTGSGIIAILASRLGAARVVGTENDPVALAVAAENARINRATVDFRLCDPEAIDGVFDVVVANILLNTLVALAPQVARKVAPGGRLVLSGLLPLQGGLAEAAYEPHGLCPAGRRERDGWLRVELSR